MPAAPEIVAWYCPQCHIKLDLPRDAFPLTCQCGFHAQSAAASLTALASSKKRPSIPRRMTNLARDTVRHVASGGRTVDDATRAARLAQCEGCIGFFDGQVCTHPNCGCGMKNSRGGFLDALSWATKRCPIGRWDRSPFVTSSELAAEATRLASQLPANATGIVGIPRSGMMPATLIANLLHLPLFELVPDGPPRRMTDGWRMQGRQEAGGPLVVVDDNQTTGNSIIRARQILGRHLAGHRVLYAVVYRCQRAKPQTRPDFVGRELPSPIFLEWNLWNSIYTPSLACDFDGILCRDGAPDKPMYLPRRCELPLVITGRTEAMRASTLHWLATWGVRVKRLEMFPGRPDELEHEVQIDRWRVWRVSQWKAEIYKRSTCSYFAESSERQAREIAGLSGKPVICPAAGRVF